jgi:hypothetical protein
LQLREEVGELQSAPANRPLASQISLPQDDQLAAAARLDQWLEQVGEAMPEVDVYQLEDREAKPQVADGPWRREVDAVYLVTAGELDSLRLDWASAAVSPVRSRVIGVAAIAIACGACLWLLRRPAALDVFYRWPHAVAFVAGLVYWAWMWPSWLGLLIAAGSLLLAVRSGWPGRAIRMEGSTVLRAGRVK